MKLLVTLLVGLIATSAGTFFATGTLQTVSQIGFVVALGVCVFLWWVERI